MCALDRGRQQTVCICREVRMCTQFVSSEEMQTSVHLLLVLLLSLYTLSTLNMQGLSVLQTWVSAKRQTHATISLLDHCWLTITTYHSQRAKDRINSLKCNICLLSNLSFSSYKCEAAQTLESKTLLLLHPSLVWYDQQLLAANVIFKQMLLCN